MAKYAANVNGDWWQVETTTSATVWMIDTDNLDAAQLEEMEQELEADKFHRFIWLNGQEMRLDN